MLKRLNSRACALETTASFLALLVPYVPGPREDAGGREALWTRMPRAYEGRARTRGPGKGDDPNPKGN